MIEIYVVHRAWGGYSEVFSAFVSEDVAKVVVERLNLLQGSLEWKITMVKVS